MKNTHKTDQTKQLFLAHMEYLLQLTSQGRKKRTDWAALQVLFKKYGYKFFKRRVKSSRKYTFNRGKSKQTGVETSGDCW
jgi:choline dehydrogenase-like flavoprotein